MADETRQSSTWDRVTLTCVTPDRGPARVARVAAFASVSLALSALAHGLGGGPLPSPVTLALAAVPILLGSLWLTGRRRGGAEILGALSLGQIGLHILFHSTAMPPRVLVHSAHHSGFGSGARRSGLTSLPASLGEHGAAGLGHGESTLAEAAGYHALLPSAQMLTWHIVAVAALAWILSRGEAALWRLAQRMRLLWGAPAPEAWASRQVVAGTGPTPWLGRRVCSVRPRGPPVRAASVG